MISTCSLVFAIEVSREGEGGWREEGDEDLAHHSLRLPGAEEDIPWKQSSKMGQWCHNACHLQMILALCQAYESVLTAANALVKALQLQHAINLRLPSFKMILQQQMPICCQTPVTFCDFLQALESVLLRIPSEGNLSSSIYG